MLNPDLHRFYAERMQAKIRPVQSSHASPVSHAEDVVELITKAAKATAST